MSKIVLKQVYLLNWYGLVDKTIPLGSNLSLITGENECGKSTILDAIKYVFSGDVEFNKASSATKVGVGRRTLASYTRCLIDPDTRKYARPASLYPEVYSHIALEYYNELDGLSFVLGVILETNSSDNVDNYWYALENKMLKDVNYFDHIDGKKYILSAKKFRDKNHSELYNKQQGLVKFMAMTGLRLQGDGILKYQRKLRNIMTYNPEAKIQKFIKESVLEDKKINLNKLKDAKTNIDNITTSLNILESEMNDLNTIIRLYNEYHYLNDKIKKDDIKTIYKEVLEITKKITTNTKIFNDNEFEIKRLDDLLNNEYSDRSQKDNELIKANIQFNEIDGSKAISDEKEKLANLQTKEKIFKDKIRLLQILSNTIKEFTTKIKPQEHDKLLYHLTDLDISSSEKNSELNDFKDQIKKLQERTNENKYKIKNHLEAIQKEINEVNEEIRNYDRNLPDYSRVVNQEGLINDINNRFKQLNINSEAKFSSFYVIEIKDEKWRDSIETFLGIHRYSIIVEPQYFDIANEVIDKSKYKYVELVNTKLLDTKIFKIEKDSLLHQLEIRNEIAKKYFAYWLGRIHAVHINDVAKYENAISQEGKISRNMAITFLDFNKLKSYCLGEDAIQLNKNNALIKKEKLLKQEKELQEKKSINDSLLTSIEATISVVNKEYDLDAPKLYNDNLIKIETTNKQITKLEEALKENGQYIELSNRIDEIKKQIEKLDDLIKGHDHDKSRRETENNSLKQTNANLNLKLKEINDKLEDLTLQYPSFTKKAIEEYNLFINDNKTSGDVLKMDIKIKLNKEREDKHREITIKQSLYNSGKRQEEILGIGLEYEIEYQKRKTRIELDNLEDIKFKLSKQTNKYESIFKNEFVLKIKTNIEEAQSDIKEINKQLRRLEFSTTYQFDVKNVTGTTDFASILDYGDYLQKTNRIDNGQMMIEAVSGYEEDEAIKREKEIKVIIDRIITTNNDELLNEFADYRNYMEYEVLVNNDEIENGRLSKLAGYNSGAGTQIPYTIILCAALAIIYNARKNSTRLIFIDEPFEKMSDKNIKIMLNFFKTQDFQVIFCAPPNKLDSIGKECDAIIPIKKIEKSNITLGAIKFHE